MIHLYFGDAKGKTTAACGLAVRAAGSGMHVLFVQFFKSGASSEVKILRGIKNMDFIFPSKHFGRYKMLAEGQKEAVRADYDAMLEQVISAARQYELIVLDEAVSAIGYGMIDKEKMLTFLKNEKQNREIVLTGREPLPELLELADYATNMQKVKHPYDKGVQARKGIEF